MIPFPEHAPPSDVPAGEKRVRVRWRRRVKPTDPRSWNLVLPSVGIAVPAHLAAESPELLTAAVADLEWRLELDELRARRPRRWRKAAMADWCAEMERLEEKRRGIAEVVADAVSAM